MSEKFSGGGGENLWLDFKEWWRESVMAKFARWTVVLGGATALMNVGAELIENGTVAGWPGSLEDKIAAAVPGIE